MVESDADWELLLLLLPGNWRELAAETGALKGLRKDKAVDGLLRTLLMHLACGHSLRETATRARAAGLADLSDVALMKRLRKSEEWLRRMCVELFRENGAPAEDGSLSMRAFDGTVVKEPGRGSLWRLHYGVRLPSLECDFFELTAAKGAGTGESLKRFPVRPGDLVLADGGYSTGGGLRHVADGGGHATVRVNPASLVLRDPDGQPFDLLGAVSSLKRAGAVGSWAATVDVPGGEPVAGRLCAIRKTRRETRLAVAKLRRRASRKQQRLRPETLRYATCVIVFTTFPEAEFDAAAVLRWYRLRWQVELVFKRFKSLAGLGHLPKRDPTSARAWLYGKLLVALLTEKTLRHASAISPWGFDWRNALPQSMARIRVRSRPDPADRRTSVVVGGNVQAMG